MNPCIVKEKHSLSRVLSIGSYGALDVLCFEHRLGWLNYHAVPGNSPSLGRFRNEVGRIWFGVLRRRSQKFRRRRWQYMARLIRYWLPPARILHPYPNERLVVT